MKPDAHFIWAKSAREQSDLEKLGWSVTGQRKCHHHQWAILMQWAGKGSPKLPTHPAVKAS